VIFAVCYTYGNEAYMKLQRNVDASFSSGVLKKNDGYEKAIDAGPKFK
jgi:hypothetical protein